MKLPSSFQLLALLGSSTVNALFRMNCGIIQTGRVDPIISYNKVSGHIHKISGAASININSTADTLLASECTSCQAQSDKSAYWTPGFYYQHVDGTFEEVPNSGMTIYYLGRGEENGKKIKPFPKGLKIFSGNSSARSFDSKALTVPGGRPIAERISFACVNYAKSAPETYGLPVSLYCPQGLRAQVHFQSCWDGKNLYLPDESHMAYLDRIDNGVCPPTHPVLLPHLFFEVNYSMDKIDTSKGGRYMFANGDTTGYGFHGDFMAAWDEEILTQAIAECIAGGKLESGVIDDCRPLNATNGAETARRCTERSPVYPCEPVHGKIKSLPGCTGGFGSVTCGEEIQPACPVTYTTIGLSASPSTDKFSHLGCYTESRNGRALRDKETRGTTGMTVEKCSDFCAGFKYFGVEYGEECYCGNSLGDGSVLTTPDRCDMKCKGNKFQTCGAGRLLNMYEAKAAGGSSSSLSMSSISSAISTSINIPPAAFSTPSGRPATSSNSTDAAIVTSTSSSGFAAASTIGTLANFRAQGCWTEAPGRALVGSSTRSDSMTPQACATYCTSQNFPLFGIEYGRECWCGTYLRQGSIKAPDADCSFACAGDKTAKCGAGDRLNLYSKLDYTKPITPQRVNIQATTLSYTYFGCYTDTNPALNSYRALSAKGMSDFSKMTVELCGNFCRDYEFFGIEWSGECYCGNEIGKGSFLREDMECGLTCPGDFRQLACGGRRRLNIYKKS